VPTALEVLVTFEEFARARLAALARYAAVLTGDRALAEDVVQEVMIRAYGRWQQIDEMAQPDAYLRRMIVNEYLSWRRRWARVVPQADAGADQLLPDFTQSHADRQAVRSELARLPRRQRAVLVLRYYEHLTDAEIAEVLDCPQGTVRSLASRALATLRVDARKQQLLGERP
jgi:RNA polymerase sigma-70 factor (sigma-E family)